MPSQREYSVEEVMSFTVQDIQAPDLVDVRIKCWLKLSPEQQKECILKLRDLVRERDEKAQSVAVDAAELEARLMQVQRSPSRTPPLDFEAMEQQMLEDERRFHKSLVDAHGRPCYPIELAPEIYKNPGSYKDIITYWDGIAPSSRPIGMQLMRWDEYRRFQQRNRDYFLPRNRFPEFQQRVVDRRREHGLDGDVRLLEDRDKQSSLDHWMEYQDYELRSYEGFERDLEKAKAALVARRKAVAETGLTAFEEAQNLDFGGFFGLSLAFGHEEGPAWERWFLAKQKLELAESRLKAAESDDLGDIFERGAWIRSFQEQIDAAQAQLDAVPKYRKEDWLRGGKYYVQEGKDERERTGKTRAARSKRHDAERQAEKALGLAREGLQAAQLDRFGEKIVRAALGKMVLAEVQSAQAQFEEDTKTLDKIKLKGRVVGALGSITHANLKIEQHQVLLKWIEQQRCEVMNGCASSRATKPISKRRSLRQTTEIQCSKPQPASKATTDPEKFKPETNEEPKAKNDVSALRSVRSSRISKPKAKWTPSKPSNRTRPQNRNGPVPPSTSSTCKRTMQRPPDVAPRRSTRTSKQPERFRPG